MSDEQKTPSDGAIYAAVSQRNMTKDEYDELMMLEIISASVEPDEDVESDEDEPDGDDYEDRVQWKSHL